MNSKQPDFDWHRKGLWLPVYDGSPALSCADETPYGARAKLLRIANKPWSQLEDEGFVIQSFVPEVAPDVRTGREVVTSNEMKYRYPALGGVHTAPNGEVFLLTRGGVTVPGPWTADGRFIAWHPKIQRDKDIERKLGYIT